MTHPLADEARNLSDPLTGFWPLSSSSMGARMRGLVFKMADELDRLTGEVEWMREQLVGWAVDSEVGGDVIGAYVAAAARAIAAGRPTDRSET